ncbi:Zinc knuckle [Popillia japonica]|uniref:Zinc knuckle n=1 Tax=Popillia japonica TaxID=7064 RepID=A0AAW1KKW6_POPJA
MEKSDFPSRLLSSKGSPIAKDVYIDDVPLPSSIFSSVTASCPKLFGRENYDEWCFAVENVFVLEGLTKYIDGTEEDSVLIAKAKAKLILTIDPTLYVHVKDATTAKDVWTKIRNLYEDTGIKVDTDSIKTKLLDMSLDGDSSQKGGALTSRDSSFRKPPRDSRRGNYNRKTFDRSKTSNDKNKSKDLNDITCYKCKRNGHYMSKCPEINASFS